MVAVFREVFRVLRDDGVLWLNYGSTYVSGGMLANLSRHFSNVQACGNDGTERQDLTEIDSSCPGPDGEYPTDSQTRRDRTPRNDQRIPEVSLPPLQKARGSGRPGVGQVPVASSLLSSQRSNVNASSPLSPPSVSTPFSSASLLKPQTSSHESQEYERRKVYTSGTVERSNSSDGRTSDKASSDSASKSPGKGAGSKTRGDSTTTFHNLKAGDDAGIPWRVALALQADGWILRSDIPWIKRSAMPESATNRPSKALEYVFLFAKKPGYYFDMDAVRKKTGGEISEEEYAKLPRGSWKEIAPTDRTSTVTDPGVACKTGDTFTHPAGRNFRNADLWFESIEAPHGMTGVGDEVVGLDTPSQSYAGAHFAVFSENLITPMIKAGSSEYGCCKKCGSPWKRVTSREKLTRERPNEYVKRTGEEGTGNSCSNTVAGVGVKTVGWQPTCECHGKFVKRKGTRLGYGAYHSHEADGVGYGLRQDGGPASDPGEPTKEFETTITEYVPSIPLEDHPVVPCTVMDVFVGSGTSCVVAITHGRRSIGIDLSEKYLRENCVPRVEGRLNSIPAMAHLTGRVAKEVKGGREL